MHKACNICPYSLTENEQECIKLIVEAGEEGISAYEVHTLIEKSYPSVYQTCKNLLNKGYIAAQESISKKNAQKTVLRATAKGRATAMLLNDWKKGQDQIQCALFE